MDISQKILSDTVIWSKYAKYIPALRRRENWGEICDRTATMHKLQYPQLATEIQEVFDNYIKAKKVLPSMRSMQFAGRPIELNNSRIFNCAYEPIDHPFAFAEAMFLLLGGCFKAGTLIKTKTGDKPIEEITVDDEILTYDEDSKEFNWVKPNWAGLTPTADKQKIKITTANGEVIYTTADHKFLTENRGWIEAKDLTEKDKIISN